MIRFPKGLIASALLVACFSHEGLSAQTAAPGAATPGPAATPRRDSAQPAAMKGISV